MEIVVNQMPTKPISNTGNAHNNVHIKCSKTSLTHDIKVPSPSKAKL